MRNAEAGLLVLVLSAILPCVSQAENKDIMKLSSGLPTTISSADKISQGSGSVMMRFNYEREKGQDNLFTINPRADYGVLPGLALRIAPSYSTGNADAANQGAVTFDAVYNIVEPSGMFPSLSVVPGISVPYGSGDETVQSEIELRASQPLGTAATAPRFHLNVAWRHLNNPASDERRNRYFAAGGVNFLVGEATSAVVDVVREPSRTRNEVDNFIELGLRHVFDDSTNFGAGIGVGFGPDSPRLRLLVGLQRSF